MLMIFVSFLLFVTYWDFFHILNKTPLPCILYFADNFVLFLLILELYQCQALQTLDVLLDVLANFLCNYFMLMIFPFYPASIMNYIDHFYC